MSRLSIYYGHIVYADPHPGESLLPASEYPIRDAVSALQSLKRYGHRQWVLGNLDVDDDTRLVYGRLGYSETDELTQQDYDDGESRFVDKQYSVPTAGSSAFVLNYAIGAVALEVGPKIRPAGFVDHLIALLNNPGVVVFHGELIRVASDYRDFLRNVDKVTRIAFEVRPTNASAREIFRPLDEGMKAGNVRRGRVVIENREEGLTVDSPVSYDEPNANLALQGIAMVEEGYGDGYRIEAEAQGHTVRYDSKMGGLLADVFEDAPDEPGERISILRDGLIGRAGQLPFSTPLEVGDVGQERTEDGRPDGY
jgi:hypothetical protein